jgi:hypothetical protein
MIGAIAGDIIGSVYEFANLRSKDFELFDSHCEVTHDHPEGIKGAQATALAVFLARTGCSKEEIASEISRRFEYDLNRTVDEIRPAYTFNESCQQTVPEAIIAFLDSTDFENAIRLAISLGGDSDTLACITGGIARRTTTRYGAGCTSGHGVCGISRLSPRSFVATLLFMGSGFATVYIARHLIGG